MRRTGIVVEIFIVLNYERRTFYTVTLFATRANVLVSLTAMKRIYFFMDEFGDINYYIMLILDCIYHCSALYSYINIYYSLWWRFYWHFSKFHFTLVFNTWSGEFNFRVYFSLKSWRQKLLIYKYLKIIFTYFFFFFLWEYRWSLLY